MRDKMWDDLIDDRGTLDSELLRIDNGIRVIREYLKIKQGDLRDAFDFIGVDTLLEALSCYCTHESRTEKSQTEKSQSTTGREQATEAKADIL